MEALVANLFLQYNELNIFVQYIESFYTSISKNFIPYEFLSYLNIVNRLFMNSLKTCTMNSISILTMSQTNNDMLIYKSTQWKKRKLVSKMNSRKKYSNTKLKSLYTENSKIQPVPRLSNKYNKKIITRIRKIIQRKSCFEREDNASIKCDFSKENTDINGKYTNNFSNNANTNCNSNNNCNGNNYDKYIQIASHIILVYNTFTKESVSSQDYFDNLNEYDNLLLFTFMDSCKNNKGKQNNLKLKKIDSTSNIEDQLDNNNNKPNSYLYEEKVFKPSEILKKKPQGKHKKIFLIEKEKIPIFTIKKQKTYNLRKDCLMKRICTHLHKFVYNKMNELLRLTTNSTDYIFKLPKRFTSNFLFGHNKLLLKSKIKDVYTIKIKDMTADSLKHNISIIQSVESKRFDSFINLTFEEAYDEYMKSSELLKHLKSLRKKEGKIYCLSIKSSLSNYISYIQQNREDTDSSLDEF